MTTLDSIIPRLDVLAIALVENFGKRSALEQSIRFAWLWSNFPTRGRCGDRVNDLPLADGDRSSRIYY
jgi:hypothetical protein